MESEMLFKGSLSLIEPASQTVAYASKLVMIPKLLSMLFEESLNEITALQC